jgi:hypothetical protein
MIDTGSPITYVNERLYNSLFHRDSGHASSAGSTHGSVCIGGHCESVTIRKAAFLIPGTDKEWTEGILGNSYFEGNEARGLRVTFDFSHSIMLIASDRLRPLYSPHAGSITVKLRQREDWHWYLATLETLEFGKLEYLVDVGSEHNCIPDRVYEKLAGPEGNRSKLVHFNFGRRSVPQQVYPDSIGDGPPSNEGTLGLDLLAEYLVVIDYRDRMLYLEPGRTSP